ncbi:MAG: FHA domain-containing protein [Solirubrobacterales bacterium]
MSKGSGTGKTIESVGDRFVIGRDEGADLTLDDAEVSREHAALKQLPGGKAEITDLGSRNGTYVNGAKISGPTVLEGGEEIKVGETTLVASGPPAPPSSGDTRGGDTQGGDTQGGDTGATKISARPPLFALKIGSGANAGKQVELSGDRFVIGRDEGADLTLDDAEVSREHAALKQLPGGKAEITDLGSRNGTYVNGAKISGPTVLEGGEEIKVGETTLVASGPGGDAGKTQFSPKPAGQAAKPPPPPPPPPPAASKKGGSGPKPAIIAAAVGGGVVLLLLVLAIAGVFSGDSSDEPLDAQEVAEHLEPSTLKVVARDHESGIVGGGSAWVYDADDGLIVTNAHVINGGRRFQAGFDSTALHNANVVGVAPCQDIAVLRMPPGGLATLERAEPSDVKQGDSVFAVGFPGNSTSDLDFLKADYQITSGSLSALDTQVREGFGDIFDDPNNNGSILLADMLQTDAAINPGNSGGPLVNDRALLVGMNTVGGGETEGQGGAISLDTLNETVPKLAAGESIGWAGFGVAALPTEQGESGAMLVTSVVRDTPADQVGLFDPNVGILVESINNQTVDTQQGYCNIVEDISPGEDVKLDLVAFDYDDEEFFEIPDVTITFP